MAVDPCIFYQDSTNETLRANCAAEGIAPDFNGAASSALIVSGGGAGVLEPETSEAFTAGIVFTPDFANLSIALDYFTFEVNDQISQLGAGAIVAGCYFGEVFPNAFCDLFDRNPGSHPTEPFKITEVRNQYLNINRQKVRGYDLVARYENDTPWGNLTTEAKFTYTMEDVVLLFDSAEESGFVDSNQLGQIGRPELVGDVRTAFERGDWTFTWNMRYVDDTRNLNFDRVQSYFGFEEAVFDIEAESRLYHTVSVGYDQPDWSATLGVRNLFDARPPLVSSGVATRYGNVPAFATQYDLFGRSLFANVTYKF